MIALGYGHSASGLAVGSAGTYRTWHTWALSMPAERAGGAGHALAVQRCWDHSAKLWPSDVIAQTI